MSSTALSTDAESVASSRGNWANKTEFILSCLGYAVGIGNVWRFPYLCYRNGGGAFLVPYFLMLPLCGLPLFFMELCIGQFSGTGCITMFKISPLFKGMGYCMVMVNLICTIYYNVILAYPLLFLYYSMAKKLPWVDCNQKWNDERCSKVCTDFLQSPIVTTPAEQFFHNEILHISSGIHEQGTIVWPLLITSTISWVVVYLCIRKGISTVGKVVYFTVLFPYLVLFSLFVRGVTLPGAWNGINYYINPKWEQLLELRVWADAATQIFFSLGPG
ncbi:LOW QUALITY PROTEIN: sodium-dependent proline transporter-like, partial [Ctenocephalides felis]